LKFYLEDEHGEDEDELYKKAPKNSAQRYLWLLLERPNRSLFGRIVAFFCLLIVILSVTIMCLETLSDSIDKKANLKNSNNPEEAALGESERRIEFFVLELVCNTVFTIEVFFRLIAAPNKIQFLKSFLNILDILAILPFWANLALTYMNNRNEYKLIESLKTNNGDNLDFMFRSNNSITVISTTVSIKTRQKNQYGLSVLRILRLTRVLRVLKLSRHIRALNIMGKILYQCVYEIILLLTFLAINIIIFSSLMYYIELHALGEKSPFISKYSTRCTKGSSEYT
jgi:hypothetical protein